MSPCALHAEDQEKQGMQQLLNRIDDLEKQLKKIEEENKARKKLEVTEEEKVQQEKEVLQAVSREYSLDPKGTLGIDYGLSYQFSRNEDIYTNPLTLRRTSDHVLTHSLSATYSMRDNLSGTMTLPVVYKYNKRGTDEELDQTDIGDISFGVAWQPVKSGAGDVRTTLSIGVSLPTGRSPYKINPSTELSTGSGYYSLSAGANFSKQVDPVVVFWSLGYEHAIPLTNLNKQVNEQYTLQEVKPGDSFSVNAGMGYALSYATTINMSFNYEYQLSTSLTYEEVASSAKSGDNVSATFGMGMGWKVSRATTLSFSLGYSLTDPTFTFQFRVPFSFVL